jgi:hypothetical protein
LPRFVAAHGITFETPIGHFLRGFAFEASAYDKEMFYLTAFVQPLFVPDSSDSAWLSVGRRLGQWEINQKSERSVMATVLEKIRRRGMPFLESFRDEASFGERVRVVFPDLRARRVREAIAYSFLLGSDLERARNELEMFIAAEESNPDSYAPERSHASVERARRLLRAAGNSPGGGAHVLKEWTHTTLSALRLEKYAEPTLDRTCS